DPAASLGAPNPSASALSALRAPAPAKPTVSALPESSASAAPTTRTVRLGIAPATASVEIDGRAATVAHGRVDVMGALGSTHHVRVYVGKKETQGDVVIADTGAVPSRIDLGANPAAPP